MARARTYKEARAGERRLKRHYAVLLKGPEERVKHHEIFDGEFERARREQPDRISRIFVGNLNHTVSYMTLVRVFKVCGPVKHASINCFQFRPDTTSFAEIIFSDPDAGEKAKSLDGLLMEGLALVVCSELSDLPEWRKSKRPKEVSDGQKHSATDHDTQAQDLAGSSATVVADPATSSKQAKY